MPDKPHICPMEKAGQLDNRFRRWIHNPLKIVAPYIKEGMTVLDVGCGVGYFTIDMARLVGTSGSVIAADLQEGMLNIVRDKISGTDLEPRITLHQCEMNRIGVSTLADFVLLFYVVHEVPQKEAFFAEIASIVKPHGHVLMVEPPFHVSKVAFEVSVGFARDAGLVEVGRPKVLFSKAVLMEKG